jgi:hypothetical protein
MGQRRGPQGTEIADKVARLFGTHFQLSRVLEIFYEESGMIVAVLLAFC